jgi:hypothetical protein
VGTAPILATDSSRWLAAASVRVVADRDEEPDEFAHLFPPTLAEWDAAVVARAAQVSAMSDEELEAELFGPEARSVGGGVNVTSGTFGTTAQVRSRWIDGRERNLLHGRNVSAETRPAPPHRATLMPDVRSTRCPGMGPAGV